MLQEQIRSSINLKKEKRFCFDQKMIKNSGTPFKNKKSFTTNLIMNETADNSLFITNRITVYGHILD